MSNITENKLVLYLEDLGDGLCALRSQAVVPHDDLVVVQVTEEVGDGYDPQPFTQSLVGRPPHHVHVVVRVVRVWKDNGVVGAFRLVVKVKGNQKAAKWSNGSKYSKPKKH